MSMKSIDIYNVRNNGNFLELFKKLYYICSLDMNKVL